MYNISRDSENQINPVNPVETFPVRFFSRVERALINVPV
jgi:hypothetical protein